MKRNIAAMQCDRCNATEDCRRIEQEYAWAKITAAECNGPKWIGSQTLALDRAKDICPSCMAELMDWWERK